MRHLAMVVAGALSLFGCETSGNAPGPAGGAGAPSAGAGGGGGASSGAAGGSGQPPMTGGSAGVSAGAAGAAGSAGASSGAGGAGASSGAGAGGELASGGIAGQAQGGAGQGAVGGGGESASGGTAAMPPTDGGTDAMPKTPLALLVYTRTGGFRHDAIPVTISTLQTLATEHDWTVTATEDPTMFSDDGLAPFDVLVFAHTTEEVLDANQQAAFERFMKSGKGLVGIHSATDTEFDWPYYGELIGAYFRGHPAIQQATIAVEDATHPSTSMLPARWTRTDEWYSFVENPRPNVHVLLTLDETTYAPAEHAMGADHPIAWTNELDGARVFQTALGHTEASYSEPLFLEHITGGIEWAGRRVP